MNFDDIELDDLNAPDSSTRTVVEEMLSELQSRFMFDFCCDPNNISVYMNNDVKMKLSKSNCIIIDVDSHYTTIKGVLYNYIINRLIRDQRHILSACKGIIYTPPYVGVAIPEINIFADQNDISIQGLSTVAVYNILQTIQTKFLMESTEMPHDKVRLIWRYDEKPVKTVLRELYKLSKLSQTNKWKDVAKKTFVNSKKLLYVVNSAVNAGELPRLSDSYYYYYKGNISLYDVYHMIHFWIMSDGLSLKKTKN